jgi:hypothetical protein
MINKRNVMERSLSMSEPGMIRLCDMMKRATANGIMSKYRRGWAI